MGMDVNILCKLVLSCLPDSLPRMPSSSSIRTRSQLEGASLFDAAVEAAQVRLRPIHHDVVSRSLSAVLPLVIAQGAGAEMRRTLGTAVFFGMLGVTLFASF